MKKHQRDLAEFLRREYGAAGVHLEPGGKHQKLAFSYQGRDHRFPVSSSPSDPSAMRVAIRQVRHALGDPPNRAKPTCSVETLMAHLNTSVAMPPPPPEELPLPPPVRPEPVPTGRTWTIRTAAYRNSKAQGAMLQFVFPHQVGREYPNGVRLEQLDPEHWKIIPGGDKRFIFLSGAAAMVKTQVRGLLPFSSMDVEAVEADGAILVYLPLIGRMPVETSKYRPMSGKSAPVSAPSTEPPAVRTMEERMRAVLLEARAIEAECPYKLIRGGGNLAWAAPVIE